MTVSLAMLEQCAKAVLDGQSVVDLCSFVSVFKKLSLNDETHSFFIKCIQLLKQIMFKMRLSTKTGKDKDAVISQQIVEMSLHDYFVKVIAPKHYHQHVMKGDVEHGCCYHTESLLLHSMMACVIAINFAVNNGHSERTILCGGFAALVHDIGKPGVVNAFNTDQYGNTISYPWHSENGGHILMHCIESVVDKNIFSYDEWMTIVQTVTFHMCAAYHNERDTPEAYAKRVAYTNAYSESVRELLSILAYGDVLGAVADEAHSTSIEDATIRCNKYHELIKTPPLSSVLANVVRDKKLIVYMRGGSGSGKTTVGKMLCKKIGDAVLIDRDEVMMTLMRANLENASASYKECYALYSKDTKTNSALVNARMREMITQEFMNGKIVVLSSLITTNLDVLKTTIPDKNHLIVAIDCLRNTLITETDAARLGCSLEMQLIPSGQNSLARPFPHGWNFYPQQIAMCTASGNPDGVSTVATPHYSLPVLWNGEQLYGFDVVCDFFDRLKQGQDYIESIDTNVQFDDDVGSLVDKFNEFASGKPVDVLVENFATWGIEMKKTKFCDDLYLVSYKDTFYCAETWSWLRALRGCYFLYDVDECKWLLLRRTMNRAPEVASFAVKKAGEDTQDGSQFSNTMLNYLSSLMPTDSPLDGILSMKVDGSLLIVSVYRSKYAEKVLKIINASSSSLNIKFNEMVQQINRDVCITFSTSGSFLIDDSSNMLPYMVTAILSGMLKSSINKSRSPVDCLMDHAESLYEKIISVASKMSENVVVSLAFEAVCKNRCDAWDVQLHTELAVTYQESMCMFLGARADGAFVQSSQIEQTCFDTPAYWCVNTTREINEILNDVDNVVLGSITVTEFFERHPTKNNMRNFDPEGFVCSITDMRFPPDTLCKIKSVIYYLCHKVRNENITKIIELFKKNPYIGSFYPIVSMVVEFIGRIDEMMRDFLNSFVGIIFDEKWHEFILEKMRGAAEKSNGTSKNCDRAAFLMNAIDDAAKSKMCDELVEAMCVRSPKLRDVDYESLKNLALSIIGKMKLMKTSKFDNSFTVRGVGLDKMASDLYDLVLRSFGASNMNKLSSSDVVQQPAAAE